MNDKKQNEAETANKATGNYTQALWKTGQKHAGNAWYQRHLGALQSPRVGFETALVAMLQGWLIYADNHAAHYDSAIGCDGVLGDHWAAIGQGLRGLLNGDAGRLDCGCLDAILNDTLSAEGFED